MSDQDQSAGNQWSDTDWTAPTEADDATVPQLAPPDEPVWTPQPAQPTEMLPPAPDTAPSDIFRDSPPAAPISAEEARLQAERAARKEARQQALTQPLPQAVPAVEAAKPVKPPKRYTDKFFPAVGLFLLRLVVAGILAIRGVQWLADVNRSQQMLVNTIIPLPWQGLVVIVVGVVLLLSAFLLVLGLGTRIAGVLIAGVCGCTLAFVEWGAFSIFQESAWPGFLGELSLLVTAVGVVFLFVGGGGWSLDHGFRARRAKAKAERAASH
jgi:uncharacterized membrane protein YphA (DoxX/SURF4 family)